jgi:hypothetical protein
MRFELAKVYFLSVFAVMALFWSARASAAEDYHFYCKILNSDDVSVHQQSTISVDPNGMFVTYVDRANNCNGVRALSDASDSSFFRTDCEWESFLDIYIEPGMVRGSSDGLMLLSSGQSLNTQRWYHCVR